MPYGYRGDGKMKQRTAFKALNGGYLVSVLNTAINNTETEEVYQDHSNTTGNMTWGPSVADFKLWVQVSAQGEDVMIGHNYSDAAIELQMPEEDHPTGALAMETMCSEFVDRTNCEAFCCKWTPDANASSNATTDAPGTRRLAKAKAGSTVDGDVVLDAEEVIAEDGECTPTSFGESVCAVEMVESTGAKLRIFWKELDSPNHAYYLFYAEQDDCMSERDKYGEAPANVEGCDTTTQRRGRCGSDVPDQECIMETACGIRRNGCFMPAVDGDASTLDHCTDEESLENLNLAMEYDDSVEATEPKAIWVHVDVPVKNNLTYYFNVIHRQAVPATAVCEDCTMWETSYAGTTAVAEYNRPLQMHSDDTILQLFGFIGIATIVLLIPFFALKFFIKSRLLKVFESSKLPSILKLKAKAAYMNMISGVSKAKNKFKGLSNKKRIHPAGGGLGGIAMTNLNKKKEGVTTNNLFLAATAKKKQGESARDIKAKAIASATPSKSSDGKISDAEVEAF